MFYPEHIADIPFCYYDKYSKKIVIRLVVHNGNADSISILYNDPYDYKIINNEYVWQYIQAEMQLQYDMDNKQTWEVEFDIPKWKRIKYAFIININSEKYYFAENVLQKVDDEKELITINLNHFLLPFAHEIDSPSVPMWVKDTVWYQIFPDRFCDGDGGNNKEITKQWDDDNVEPRDFYGGDLAGIISKFDYLQELGINGIYLTPIFTSDSNHKYDTTDYMEIDPRFGDKETLHKLIDEAHKRGMKVMLDAVFNHIGYKHRFWQDVLENQEKSKYKDCFHVHSFPVKDKYKDYNDIPYDVFAFTTTMPKWNTENEEARKYLLDVSKYWIEEFDIDGWRLDVANEVSFDFWKDFSRIVRETKPDIYILGEIWYNSAKWINNGYFDAVMNYPIGFSINRLFAERTITAKEFTETIFNVNTKYSNLHNSVQFNLLDSHDTARVLTKAKGNKQNVKNAFAMLFTLQGSPCVYYGTEVGLDGADDPMCRKPMLWGDKQDVQLLEYFKELIEYRKKYLHLIQDNNISYDEQNDICTWTFVSENGTIKLVFNNSNNDILLEKNVVFTTSTDKNNLLQNTVAIYVTEKSI